MGLRKKLAVVFVRTPRPHLILDLEMRQEEDMVYQRWLAGPNEERLWLCKVCHMARAVDKIDVMKHVFVHFVSDHWRSVC